MQMQEQLMKVVLLVNCTQCERELGCKIGKPGSAVERKEERRSREQSRGRRKKDGFWSNQQISKYPGTAQKMLESRRYLA